MTINKANKVVNIEFHLPIVNLCKRFIYYLSTELRDIFLVILVVTYMLLCCYYYTYIAE